MTNREWLQTFTDEELAVWCDIASFEKDCSVDGKVQWLKKEKVQ